MEFTVGIENLRALRSFCFSPPEGLSCLTGPNGSGKTTFLLALKTLHHALRRDDLGTAMLNGLGLFRLKNAHANETDRVTLSIKVGDVKWAIEVIERSGSIESLAKESVHVGGVLLLQRFAASRAVYYQGLTELPNPPDDDRLALRFALERTGDPSLRTIRDWFDGLSIFHDLDLYGLRVNASRVGMDHHLHSRGQNVYTMLRKWSERREDRFRIDFVKRVLSKAFPGVCSDLDFDANSQTIMLRTYRPYEELPLSAANEANGLLAMTVYASALAAAPDGGCVIIDEPETALHPHAIHEFITICRQWSRDHGLRVLFVTHSPIILDAFHEERDRLFLMDPEQAQQPITLAEHPDHEWMAHFSPGKLYGHEEVAAPIYPTVTRSS